VSVTPGSRGVSLTIRVRTGIDNKQLTKTDAEKKERNNTKKRRHVCNGKDKQTTN
jgi:hypothetical protein